MSEAAVQQGSGSALVTGITTSAVKILKGIGNRYRIAFLENKVDDMIAPEAGVSGWVLDKVEDTANFLTMGLVARVKDGIKTKGYAEMSNDEVISALSEQYSKNITEKADKAVEKQEKAWAKVEKKMDKTAAKDAKIDLSRERARNAEVLYSSGTLDSNEESLEAE